MSFRLCLVLGLQLVVFVFSIGLVSAAPHKGATYSTKTFPPADCNDYIDPKDSTKFSHCEKLVKPSSNKWQGYIEFMGKPGTARSIGQSDLFVPLIQDENDMTFFNLRGQLDDGNNDEFNLGLGHRHMFKEWIIGGYGYYDRRFLESGNEFYQTTFGLEALSETWDFRANGYIPESEWSSSGNEGKPIGSSQIGSSSQSGASVVRAGGQINISIGNNSIAAFERSLPGFDLEAGVRLPIERFTGLDLLEDTRLYVSGYHFMGSGDFESVTGPRLRLETRLHDIPGLGNGSRLLLGVETQYDEPRGNQTFGLVSVRIPFGGGWTPNHPPLKGLERRMMEPVVRDIDVVTSTTTVVSNTQELLPALGPNGDEYAAALDVTQGESESDLEFQTRITTLVGGLAFGDRESLVFVQGNSTDSTLGWSGFVAPARVTLVSAGSTVMLGYTSSINGVGKVGYGLDGDPLTIELDSSSSCDNALMTMADDSRLHGWAINASGCTSGIGLTTAGDYFITSSTIFNAGSGSDGENINLTNGTLHVDDLGLYGTNTGIRITGGTAMDGEPKLRGFVGTEGTIHRGGGTIFTEPEGARLIDVYAHTFGTANSIQPSAKITLSNIRTELDEGDDALIAGITADADAYDYGIAINREDLTSTQARNFFITRTTVVGGGSAGILIDGRDDAGIRSSDAQSYLYLTDVAVLGVGVDDNERTDGVTLQKHAAVIADNLTIQDHYIGLRLEDEDVSMRNDREAQIGNSQIANNGFGVFLAGGTLTIANTVISGSTMVNQFSGDGISLFDDREPPGLDLSTGINTPSVTVLNISDSIVRDNAVNGINAQGSSVITISNTDIHGNGQASPTDFGAGMYSRALVQQGSCETGGSGGANICAEATPVIEVTGSRIYNNINGIYADFGSSFLRLTRTTVEENELDGVFVRTGRDQAGNPYELGEPRPVVIIDDSFVRNNGRDGIHHEAGGSEGDAVGSVDVKRTDITGNGRYGVYLSGGGVPSSNIGQVEITDGSILRNAGYDVFADVFTFNGPLLDDDGNPILIGGNPITGMRSTPSLIELVNGSSGGIQIDRARLMVAGDSVIEIDDVDINAP